MINERTIDQVETFEIEMRNRIEQTKNLYNETVLCGA